MSNVIETTDLMKRFRSTWAVDGLSLGVPEGSIYALLGPNGAGKTTTIKTVMNMYRPSAGSTRLLGVDSRRIGPTELRQVGYVSENQELPTWMSVGRLLAFCRPLYPTWDEGFSERLMNFFKLQPHLKVGELSRGMRMKAALLVSLSYRPRLLVMDEPFTGLDALVRDELIRGVLELSEDGGWTVLISSHDIDEVERLADRVAIIDAGRCRLEEPVGNLQARFRRMELVVTDRTTVPDRPPPEWLVVERAGTRLTFVHSDYSAEATPEELTRHLGVWQSDEATRMSLKEIFLALARTYDLHEGGRS